MTIRHVEIETPSRRTARIAYRENGEGRRLLLLRGFASADGIWTALRHSFPADSFAVCSLDLPGTGDAELDGEYPLDVKSQSEVLAAFVRKRRFEDIVLVTHGLGAWTVLEALREPDFARRVDRIVFIGADGVSGMPPLIKEILRYADEGAVSRFASPELGAYLWLQDGFFDPAKITPLLVDSLSSFLMRPGAVAAIARAARSLSLPDGEETRGVLNQMTIPALIIQGEYDSGNARATADFLHEHLARSIQKVIGECGHFAQCEYPEVCAAVIGDFASGALDNKLSDNAAETGRDENWFSAMRRKLDRKRRFRMSKLVDSWSIDSLLLICFVKILQLLKRFGMDPNENGWRKATGIFMKSDASKFMLGTFRLRYWPGAAPPASFAEAKRILIGRLGDFLRRHSELRWAVKDGFFRLRRQRLEFCDIAEVDFNSDGTLKKLVPHFDPAADNFDSVKPEAKAAMLGALVEEYNSLFKLNREVDPVRLTRRLWRWMLRERRFSFTIRSDFRRMLNRILSATFIRCEHLSGNPARMFRRRISTPDTRLERNFGWGLLNIKARFTTKFDEVDLWVQYHHVPVDGMPMQELLTELKKQWGAAGEIVYPDPGTPMARTEITYAGHAVFRARMLVDFTGFLQVRKKLNAKYAGAMGGSATIAGMVLWGLAQHPFFRNRKMLLPVDIVRGVKHRDEREMSLVFIRPGEYMNVEDPLNGFIRFQREFNLRTSRTRTGRSESYEVLELYSMIHPVFYYIAKYLMPSALKEIVGTVGLSIMRDSEVFIAPLSDLQTDGFMAMGNLSVPTVSGGRAGVVSICGTRRQIGAYLEAVTAFAAHYDDFLTQPDKTGEQGT